jgi:D-3-phosphoglycerate dehydrogenase
VKWCEELPEVAKVTWPHSVSNNDVIVFTAPLTPETYHMFNDDLLSLLKPGIKVINVGRGQVVKQDSLIRGLEEGVVSSAALDVYESEPFYIAAEPNLSKFADRLIFGSHNGSNTQEAVTHVSLLCVEKLKFFLEAI